MIYKEHLLLTVDPIIREAVLLFHFGLGKTYDIQVLHAKLNEDQLHCIEKQGGDLEAVNKLRVSLSLHKLNSHTNIQVIKKKWGKYLLNGTGIVIAVQKKAYRYKKTRDIEMVIEWFQQLKPELKIETHTNPQYESIFIGYNVKETKEDVVKEAAPNEQI